MKVFVLLNRILDGCLIAFFVLAFLCGLYSTVDSLLVYGHASDSSLLKYKPGVETPAEGGTQALTGNVAWLTVDGTNIDYPVMQGQDNSEYLNKDPYGDYSLSGSIFLDSGNTPDFSDSYNLVYGHHMEQGKMFGPLDSYLDESFFKSHLHGSLIVDDKTYYDITFFAVLKTTAENYIIFDPQTSDAGKVTEELQDKALYRKGTGSGHIIALSTCKDTDSTDRVVLVGNLKEGKMPETKKGQPVKTVRQRTVQGGKMILPWIILAAAVVLIIRTAKGRTGKKE